MTRFYFHLHECDEVVVDEEGCELPDLNAARSLAVHYARDIMSAEVKDGRLCLSCCMVIENDRRDELLRIRFSDVLAVTGLRH